MWQKRFDIRWLLLLMMVHFNCQKQIGKDIDLSTNGNVVMEFKAVAGTQPLQFNTTYQNVFLEDYKVSAFKFYISSLAFKRSTDQLKVPATGEQYFLYNAADSSSSRMNVQLPASEYDQLVFVIGVDSLRNVSGAQTGALDPANGMFWTWNSGYIMAKLEGNSTFSNQPNQSFEYHIGGFSGAYNVLKTVTLNLPSTMKLSSDKTSVIQIQADVASWFSSPNDIKISTTPVCTTPGVLAKQIADNYSKMFRVVSVTNQ